MLNFGNELKAELSVEFVSVVIMGRGKARQTSCSPRERCGLPLARGLGLMESEEGLTVQRGLAGQ